jgi:hypothetical protein
MGFYVYVCECAHILVDFYLIFRIVAASIHLDFVSFAISILLLYYYFGLPQELLNYFLYHKERFII